MRQIIVKVTIFWEVTEHGLLETHFLQGRGAKDRQQEEASIANEKHDVSLKKGIYSFGLWTRYIWLELLIKKYCRVFARQRDSN
jgi:hypothetical protein